jgi:hypothetical protein
VLSSEDVASELDLERLRREGPMPVRRAENGPRQSISCGAAKPERPSPRPGERFVLGPLPWPWLTLAMGLPGRALHVAIRLWYQSGLERSGQVGLNLSRIEGIDRFAAGRGLRALESAKLVQIDRRAGRKPVVTLLSPSDPTPEANEVVE